jgi:CRISPR-associated protein Cst2
MFYLGVNRKEGIEMTKAFEVVYLTRIEGANLNAAGTEGIISILKKTVDIDGGEYLRISGQSVKYQIRQIWKEKGLPVSEIRARQEAAEKVIVSAGKPIENVDDDLFGYMLAGIPREKDRKRTAVVRTNGMISLFPYRGDRDFGVRYDPNDPMGKHNIYEVEVTTNVMRGNVFVELDRLGKFDRYELGADKEEEINTKEKEKRLQALFDALFHFWGGAHLSNYFTKTYPEIMLVAFLNRKFPMIGDKLTVKGQKEEGKYILELDNLKETFFTFDSCIDEIMIGGFKTVLANWKELRKLANQKIKVLSLKKLMEEITKRKFFTE